MAVCLSGCMLWCCEHALMDPGGGPAPSSPMASSETEMNRRESEALQVSINQAAPYT